MKRLCAYNFKLRRPLLRGRDDVYEDAVLGRLREAGLISYPSPLLAPFIEELPEVFTAEVLPRAGAAE